MSYANVGMMYPVFAPFVSHVDGEMPQYGTGRVIHEARTANVTREFGDNPLHGDDRIVDDDNGMTGLRIEFESTGLDDEDRVTLFGEESAGTTLGGYWESDNETPYGGFAYIRKMRGDAGKKYEVWLALKIKFQEATQSTTTRQGQISWGTPTITGRGASLDVDGSGKERFRIHQTFDTVSAAKAWINTMLNVSAATT